MVDLDCQAGGRGVAGGLSRSSCVLGLGLSAGVKGSRSAVDCVRWCCATGRARALDQGQWVGRCRIGRRCGRAKRAGTLTMGRRRVDPRARVYRSAARTPAARSRLWAIAAHRTQTELAPKRPDGRWASGPSIRSANTVSMIASWRWGMSAGLDGQVGVGEERVIPPDRKQGVPKQASLTLSAPDDLSDARPKA